MTILQACSEFQKRYHLWAVSVAKQEVEQSFPHFRTFKAGITWSFYQFARQLTIEEQYEFMRLSLMLSQSRQSGRSDKPLDKSDEEMLGRYQKYYLARRGLEVEIPARRRAGERINFASKKKLAQSITRKFVDEFAGRGVEIEPPFHQGIGFRLTCADWFVITTFNFGRQAGEMSYRHLIAGEVGQIHSDGTVTPPTPVLQVMSWINVCPIQWECILNEDIEPVCHSAVKLCREVFDALPTLLLGIERVKVISN